ncbi:MAG: cytochrome c [Bacteroidetes bacterium]|nr:cytochrome c [Bacteroidota bacterium]
MKNIITTSFFILFLISCICSNMSCTKVSSIVSFEGDIKPIWDAKCMSCHQTGLNYAVTIKNDYTSIKNKWDAIYNRIKKNETDNGFMPKGGTKLNDAELALFTNWKAGDYIEKE